MGWRDSLFLLDTTLSPLGLLSLTLRRYIRSIGLYSRSYNNRWSYQAIDPLHASRDCLQRDHSNKFCNEEIQKERNHPSQLLVLEILSISIWHILDRCPRWALSQRCEPFQNVSTKYQVDPEQFLWLMYWRVYGLRFQRRHRLPFWFARRKDPYTADFQFSCCHDIFHVIVVAYVATFRFEKGGSSWWLYTLLNRE